MTPYSHLAEPRRAVVHTILSSIKAIDIATTTGVRHWAAHVLELVVVVFELRTGTESAIFQLQTPAQEQYVEYSA